MARRWRYRAPLASALLAVVGAACGRPVEPPGLPRPHAPRPAEASSTPGAPETAPSGAEAPEPWPAEPTPSPSRIVVKAPSVTGMDRELRELGIDPHALPTLDMLPPDKLRGVMKTFTKALGVPCSHCHDPKDFRAPTANKTIARHMWNDVTRVLALEDGGALYCDSCHDGRPALLDRTNLEALGDWMATSYVGALARVDGEEHGCATCHGDPFEPKIFTRRWR